ncbi:hypothetical protein GFB56_25680 [Ensifer sp. T173]|uniref:Uncharacterized protein n=1 Tax=Ensifer canadensis TaxID=555315 RepID=A0AAW4FS93_9HYPH|nr:hypothetical protein [Ensifer canadensis]MBM3094140.1 hypothetical protein [Ensifer canadensis]UBI78224.1 hypothetical protein J3R84_27360 [Ensifer canadensis]
MNTLSFLSTRHEVDSGDEAYTCSSSPGFAVYEVISTDILTEARSLVQVELNTFSFLRRALP